MRIETAIRRLQALIAHGWRIEARHRTETTQIPVERLEELKDGLPGETIYTFTATRALPGGRVTLEIEGANAAVIAGELVDLCAGVVVTE